MKKLIGFSVALLAMGPFTAHAACVDNNLQGDTPQITCENADFTNGSPLRTGNTATIGLSDGVAFYSEDTTDGPIGIGTAHDGGSAGYGISTAGGSVQEFTGSSYDPSTSTSTTDAAKNVVTDKINSG